MSNIMRIIVNIIIIILYIVVVLLLIFNFYNYNKSYFSDIDIFDDQQDTGGVYNFREIEPVILQKDFKSG